MHRHRNEGNKCLKGGKEKSILPFPPSGIFPLRIDYRPAVGETCLSFTGLDT